MFFVSLFLIILEATPRGAFVGQGDKNRTLLPMNIVVLILLMNFSPLALRASCSEQNQFELIVKSLEGRFPARRITMPLELKCQL
jgi:hypothetical protein